MQELLLQSWGGIIRVFPSVPRAWPTAMFDCLWAEGRIVVSARREHGSTQFVQLCNRGEMSGFVRQRAMWSLDGMSDPCWCLIFGHSHADADAE